MTIPTLTKLFNPVLITLKNLGGSASIAELEAGVVQYLGLPDTELDGVTRAQLHWRLAFARCHLKACGLLNNPVRGVWVLTAQGKETDTVDPRKVMRIFQDRKKRKEASQSTILPCRPK